MNPKTMILLASSLVSSTALAETPEASTSRLAPEVDVEVDPIAYALGGYSLHAGFTWNRVRLDLGAFALEVPEGLHGTEGIEVYASGFGAKLDVQPIASLGLVVGAKLNRSRETVTATASRESRTAWQTSLGLRVGYRIPIAAGFYALPWIGVGVSLGDRAQQVGGVDYDPGRLVVFPTVHLGKRF